MMAGVLARIVAHRRVLVLGVAVLVGYACSPGNDGGRTIGPSSFIPPSGNTGGGNGAGNQNGVGAQGGAEAPPPLINVDSGVYHPPSKSGGMTGAGGMSAPTPTMTAPLPPPSPTPVVINECPGPISAATLAALQKGGAMSGFRLLYPYNNTVFPVGLLPPVFQWDGVANADAVYVHMKSGLFEYTGCFGPSATLNIADATWKQAGVQTGGASDPLNVEVSVQSGGNVYGPVKLTLVFAPGKLKGDLFYNTYTSPQAGNNGAVMKLRLGAAMPEVFLTDKGASPLGPCWSCHSLSANGGMLVAQHHQYPGGPYLSASFDLVANPTLSPPPKAQVQGATAEMGLGAVYPDGTKVLTTGNSGDSTSNVFLSFPDAPGNIPGMLGPAKTRLLDTATGNEIPLNGWDVQYAQMPSFSPDGTMIAFNWYDKSQGHTLAVANFDNATNTISNIREILTHPSLFVGWPWITPDNKEIVYVLGSTADYVSGYPGRLGIATSDLWIADVATGKARPLARANGYTKDGQPTYLPRPNRDEHYQFFPTISPIQAGGYFWIFFTSRRTYGNAITQVVEDAVTKKIWVSAINIRPGNDIIEDPSNPPFYLPGQEDAAGNVRGFAALEPCHKDGESCETGIDCCKGKCYMGKCGVPPPPPPPPPGEPPPPPPPPRCSNIDERCETAADCCDKRATCVTHFCAIIEPPR